MVPIRAEHQDSLILTAPTDRQQADAELAPPAPLQPVLLSTAASLELSSSAAAAPQDRLSSMSPELLSHVFVLSDYSKPISGPLLPHTRANRYRSIGIHSAKALQALCDLIATEPELGALVSRLKISQRWPEPYWRVYPRDVWREVLAALFQLLKMVKNLTVEGCLVSLVLSHDVASTSFRQLEVLSFQACFTQYDDPLKIARFACLKHYSQLKSLYVEIIPRTTRLIDSPRSRTDEEVEVSDQEVSDSSDSSEDEGEGGREGGVSVAGGYSRRGQQVVIKPYRVACTASTHKDDLVFGSIEALHLVAGMRDPVSLSFVECFPSVTRLFLHDCLCEGAWLFTAFLSLYNRAASIKHLDLDAGWDSSDNWWENPDDPAAGLQRFTSLQSLTLNYDVFGARIFQQIRDPLPIDTLELDTEWGDRELIANLRCLLIEGPTRLTSLKTLVCDGIAVGKFGTRIADAGPWYDEGSSVPAVHPDWELAKWCWEQGDNEGESELLELAKGQGVEIEGDLLDRLEVHCAWCHDVRLALSWEDDHREEGKAAEVLQE